MSKRMAATIAKTMTTEEAAMKIQGLFRTRHAKKMMASLIKDVFEKHYDPSTGLFFYHNTVTKESTWIKPKGLGSDDIDPKRKQQVPLTDNRASGEPTRVSVEESTANESPLSSRVPNGLDVEDEELLQTIEDEGACNKKHSSYSSDRDSTGSWNSQDDIGASDLSSYSDYESDDQSVSESSEEDILKEIEEVEKGSDLEHMQIETTFPGDKKSFPEHGDTVRVHYSVQVLGDPTPIISSRAEGRPLEFVLGEGQVVRGIDRALATFSAGQRAKVTLEPEYAYGEKGLPPLIPPDSALVFDIELISFRPPANRETPLIVRSTNLLNSDKDHDFWRRRVGMPIVR